jgi:hypothetical protein
MASSTGCWWCHDGRGVIAADGAEQARVRLIDQQLIEVAIRRGALSPARDDRPVRGR